jgi:ribosome maturation factor RimP
VWDLAQPLCDSQEIELVHIEYRREPAGRTLRIYIDKHSGITLEDCVSFSRQLGDLLDIYIESENAYNLEVSSPGTDRPLGRIEDFDRFKGNWARIRTTQPINGQRNFKGILLGLSKENIKLRAGDNKIVEIAFENIAKARLVDDSGEDRCS